ncbi:MAG: maleylpyruvate isomerase family mycothiol-dependent enzyme [Acidimicrobiales bacterium]
MTITDLAELRPIERPEATTLAQDEVALMAAALRSLDGDDWTRSTDCPLWDVRAMAGHVLGMTNTFTSFRRLMADMRAGGKRAGKGPIIDGLTAVQVDANADLSPDELIARLEAAGPVNARWRARRRFVRRAPLKEEVDGVAETWKMGYLLDVVLTRDTWMHRSDIARATGRPMELTAAHDGRIVADAAAEWARRHGKPCTLHLTGPAGGTFRQGDGGEAITIDAVDFCRILSGRGTGEGLLQQQVPF